MTRYCVIFENGRYAVVSEIFSLPRAALTTYERACRLADYLSTRRCRVAKTCLSAYAA